MEVIQTDIQLDMRWARPAELERLPLSGKTVKFRSHSGQGIGFRGKEYKPDEDGIVRDVPIEAIQQIAGATYWLRGEPKAVSFDIIPEEPKSEFV
jgi:hypothetical protein